MVYFVLFPGYGMTKHAWSLNLDLKKINFLDELKKLGKVYTYTPLYNNIFFYDTPHKYTKLYDKNIDFDLNYLDIEKHCKMIYDEIRKKSNDKFVVIGHSIGSIFCYYFTKLYKKDCLFSIVIDGMLLYKSNKDKNKSKNNNITDDEIKTLQYKIKKNKKKSDINKLSNITFDVIRKQIPKNIIFPIKTIYFRNLQLNYEMLNKKTSWQFNFTKDSLYEAEKLQKTNKLFKINYVINKTHFLHYYQECSNEIINEIKTQLNKL